MLNENLRKAREQASMTKAELARNLEIPYSTYDSYETGHRTPKPDQLPAIAEALGVSVLYLLDGKTQDERDAAYKKADDETKARVAKRFDELRTWKEARDVYLAGIDEDNRKAFDTLAKSIREKNTP